MPTKHTFRHITEDDEGNRVVQYHVVIRDGTVEEPDPTPDPPPDPDPPPVPAYTPTPYIVVTDQLNVREYPTTTSKIVDKINRGTVVNVYDKPVDAQMLAYLGVASSIQTTYIWRYSPDTKRFYAESGEGYTLLKPYVPTTPGPDPLPPPGSSTINVKRSDGMQLVRSGWGLWTVPGFAGIGANCRPLAYFGTSVIPATQTGDITWLMIQYKASGLRHVRFYVSHRDFTFEDQMARLKAVLDITAAVGVQCVVTFMDSIGQSGFIVKPDESYHNAPIGHLNVNYYRDKRWRINAAPRIAEVAKLLKNYTHVVLDLCNEPAIVAADLTEENFNLFRLCWQELSKIAYDNGEGKFPITVGVINVDHFKPAGWTSTRAADAFYSQLPYIHLVSVHPYYEAGTVGPEFNFEVGARADAEAAQTYGKATLVGEFGVDVAHAGKRPSITSGFLTRYGIAYDVTAAQWWEYDPNQFDRGYCGGHCIAPYRAGDMVDMLNTFRAYDTDWFGKLRTE